MEITPEYLFQVTGEMTVGERILRMQLATNQQKLIEAEKKIEGLQKEKEEK